MCKPFFTLVCWETTVGSETRKTDPIVQNPRFTQNDGLYNIHGMHTVAPPHFQPVVTEKEEANGEDVIAPRVAMKESPKMTVNDFELLKTIGKGSFGKVFEVPSLYESLRVGTHEGDRKDLRHEGNEQEPDHGVRPLETPHV